MRKETPDSEAVASSEDERPWPAAPSFGTLPRKENGMSGISGGIWSNQKRGSFKLDKTPQRSVAQRDSRLGAINPPRSIMRSDSTPSPSASDGSGALPFSIPLQPTPKAGRSLSHSQGQREGAQPPGSASRSGEQSMVLSLGLLAEEVDTETDSELGGALTHTMSHPPIGTLQRMSTLPPTFESLYGMGQVRGAAHGHAGARADKKLEAAFANLGLDPSQRRAQWQTHLGWDDVPNLNESRRHSMAEIPTRRGSLAGADGRPPPSGGSYWPNGLMYNWEEETQSSEHSYRDSQSLLSYGGTSHDLNKSTDASNRSETLDHLSYTDHTDGTIDIPSMYKAPALRLGEHERSEQDKRVPPLMNTAGHWGPTSGPGMARPRKLLYIVSFKCSRVEVFYLLENTGLSIKEGDIVIVEADRGQDLGTVQHANVSPDDARLYKRKYGEEQYKWLMMFSKNNAHTNVNPNAQQFGENSAGGGNGRNNSSLIANAPATMQGSPRGDMHNLKPKAIKRLANLHEIRMLSEKEGNEAKAKRACQGKVAHLHLDMEILDAEWQWDFQKLIFYYYADHYINFKDLITELYRIYKTRIWMSAINPASFSQHAAGQPPSGIGPGAVGGYNPLTANNNYTMMYGADPDPYGAIPPYRIGYETYTPNYPGIPGVANSFAPQGMTGGATAPGFGHYGSGDATGGDVTPSAVTTAGEMQQFYHDRNMGNTAELTPRPFPAAAPTNPDFAGYNAGLFYPTTAAAPAVPTPDRGTAPYNAYTYNAFNPFDPRTVAPNPVGMSLPPRGMAAMPAMAPIGTRAPGTSLTPTSFSTPPASGTPGHGTPAQGVGLAWRSRPTAEFVPGQSAMGGAGAAGGFGGGSPAPGGGWFSAGAARGSAAAGGSGGVGVRDERMKAYLEGLGEKKGE